MNLLSGLVGLVIVLIGLGMLVCCVLTIVKMFQRDDSGLGILCLCLLLLCGVGALVTFCIGWAKVDDYDNRSVMIAWSGLVIANIVISVLAKMGSILF